MNQIEKYIERLKQLQSLYEVGQPQHNAFGIAINEANEMLVKNCIKPDVNVRFLFDMGIKYVNELAEETGQRLHDDTARMVAKDYTKHVAHFIKNAR